MSAKAILPRKIKDCHKCKEYDTFLFSMFLQGLCTEKKLERLMQYEWQEITKDEIRGLEQELKSRLAGTFRKPGPDYHDRKIMKEMDGVFARFRK